LQNRILLMLILLLVFLPESNGQPGNDGSAEKLLASWAEVSTMNISPQANAWIEEGNLIVADYREWQQLQVSTLDSMSRVQVEKSINELGVRLQFLLRKVEQARIFSMSPEELMALREQYQQESDSLQNSYDGLRDQILVEGDTFLHTYPSDPLLRKYKRKDVVADMCMRLGELHQQQAQEAYYDELDQYEQRMQSAAEQGIAFREDPPEADLSRSVELYLKIVNEFPNSLYVADALYNLAIIQERSDDPVKQQEAVQFYASLAERFPESRYAAEAWMRIGEYWYSKGSPEDYALAIDAYTRVLEYPEYASRDKALYKLGWTNYQMLEYEQSVDYFTQTVEHTKQQRLDGKDALAALEDESIRYIAINYADPEWEQGGTENLATYIQEQDAIYGDYGFTLALTYADILKDEALDFRLAVDAYDMVLGLYPGSATGPLVLEKLIACYAGQALNRPELAYMARNRFGEMFLENEEWLQENSADSLLDSARGVMNNHQLSNVNQALRKAEGDNSIASYEEFLQQARRFLNLFPADSNAFQVHWNLAKVLETPLERFDIAWEEFLLITTLYPPERDVMPASINAIVMAQYLVGQMPLFEPDSAAAWELAPDEEKLVEALERFVELFPEAEQSPEYLNNMGGIYHQHRLWSEARVYFQRLITDYPQSVLTGDAYLFTIEGYFEQLNFSGAEAAARELAALALTPALVARAEEALAQAVFSSANLLRGGDDHLAAAEEFKRVAMEVPDADFADASLFDAAAEYRKAEAWQEAAETYLLLVNNYPVSDFADRALRLAAYTYLDELENMSAAGQSFEQLALDYVDSEYSQEGLTNAAFCYYQNEDWESTLRVNNHYLQLWPDAENAASVMFGNAELYLKLEQLSAANSIYHDFALRFPNDPRTVRAYYERGQYFLSHGDSTQALTEFRSTTARNRELAQAGHETGDFYAARALHYLVLREYEAYTAMQLLQPQSLQEQLLTQKKNARAELLDQLYELIGYSTRDYFEARYLVASVHENFANTYLAQEQPPYANQEDEIAALDRIDATGAELSTIARDDYLVAIDEMSDALTGIDDRQHRLSLRQQNLQNWLDMLPDSVSAPEDSLNQLLESRRSLAMVDTSLIEGEHWIRESRQRVPTISWAEAERSEQRVQMFYDAPIIQGAPEIRLNYRNAVLSRFVLSATKECIDAYLQVLEHAAEVGLASSWRGRVTERFASFVGHPLTGYEELFEMASTSVSGMASSFAALLEQGEDAVDADGMAAGDLGFYYLDLLDYRQSYLMNSINTEAELLSILNSSTIATDLVAARGDSVLYHILQSVRQMEVEEQLAQENRDQAWSRYEETSSWIWDDASATWDDAAFALGDNTLLALTAADEIISEYQLTGSIVKRVWFKLAQLKPEQFGDRFGLAEEKATVGTSPEWLVSTTYQRGYTELDFDDSNWETARATGNQAIVDRSGLKSGDGVAIWWYPVAAETGTEIDTLVQFDTLQVSDEVSSGDTLWFRHRFNMENSPVSAELWVTADDNYSIYLNGEYISEDRGGTEDWSEVYQIELRDYVLSGNNLIAVEAIDEDNTARGLLVSFKLSTVPLLTDDLFEQKLREDALEAERLQRAVERDRLYERHRIH
jgi:cellulose synthase operon protein C